MSPTTSLNVDGVTPDELRAILSMASRWGRDYAASCPQDTPHVSRDHMTELARKAEMLHTRVREMER